MVDFLVREPHRTLFVVLLVLGQWRTTRHSLVSSCIYLANELLGGLHLLWIHAQEVELTVVAAFVRSGSGGETHAVGFADVVDGRVIAHNWNQTGSHGTFGGMSSR